MKIGILGSGLAGLVAARALALRGERPVVLELAPEIGAPGPRLEVGAEAVDTLCQPIRQSDTALLGLLAELGLLGQIRWRTTRTAVVVGGELRPLDRALDFFAPADPGWVDRKRARAAQAYATRIRRYSADLDRVPALEWLETLFGRRMGDSLWRPYLHRRFGDYADGLPASWAWRFLHDLRRAASGPVEGFLACGTRGLSALLCGEIERAGGEVHVNVRASAVDLDSEGPRVELDGRLGVTFDALISTLPYAELTKRVRGSLVSRLPAPASATRSRVCATVVVRRAGSQFFRALVVDPEIPFDEIVEPARLVPLRERHVLHLLRSAGELTSSAASSNNARVEADVLETLGRVYGIAPGEVETICIARDPHGDAVCTEPLLRTRTLSVPKTRVFLCSKTDAYSRRLCWDTEVSLAREVVPALLGACPIPGPGSRAAEGPKDLRSVGGGSARPTGGTTYLRSDVAR